jgi:hypothetical protein
MQSSKKRDGDIHQPVALPPLQRVPAPPTDVDTCSPVAQTTVTGSNRFPFSNFKSFALSFQSSFHLSLAVLVRYRSLADI